MENYLGLVNGLSGLPEDTPGHEFGTSEHDDFFAGQDAVASAHQQQHSLPSFPEAFGDPNHCHCPLYGDFLQQQYHQTVLPFPPRSPANVPRDFNDGTADLAPLHLGRNPWDSSNSNSPCQTGVSEPAALQWPDRTPAHRPFSCLSHAPPHSQLQQLQQQRHPPPFDNHPINPHPFNTSLGLDLALNWDLNLHHTHHHTTQQPASISQAPLPRPALSPTTTAPPIARPEHEYAPFSNQAPPFFAQEQSLQRPQPAPGGLHFVTTLQPSGADFDHLSSPYGRDDPPFPFWPQSMTSAPVSNSDSFEPETTMPSLANAPPARRRSSRRLSNSVVDLTKEESRDNITSSSPVPMAPPPTRKRRRSTTTGGGTSASTARRTSASQASKVIKTEAKRPSSRGDDTCVFGSSPPPAFHSDEDVLDLTEANEVSTDQKKIEADRRVKLSKFQCVICMDDVSNLTVTHCGHLFCSECLHSALHIDSTKKSCPVCRTKVDLRSKTGKNTKSYYHLELKVMTATRKGKQPAAANR